MSVRRHLSKTVSLAVLTVSALVCGCSTPGSSLFKTNTEQSILSWSAANHEEAIYYAQKALQSNPKDTYAMMVAALSYENLGYPDKAKAFYEQIVAQEKGGIGMLGAVRNTPAEDLKKAAQDKLNVLNGKNAPIAVMNPATQTATFTQSAFPEQINVSVSGQVSPLADADVTINKGAAKGGLDMLEEGDRNVIRRFLTFIRLRDEKYVTEDEWLMRRSVNLGGLLPYTLSPAGQGLNLPAPSGDVIIGRLNALRNALEIRAITPREHAAEREIILEALLPANPFYRMAPQVPPQDILSGATALRRIEMLKNLKLITPDEAKKESAAIEKLTYSKLGMLENGGEPNRAASKCIQKCLSAPANPCPVVAPVKKPAVKKTAVKKAVVKKPAPKTCPCL